MKSIARLCAYIEIRLLFRLILSNSIGLDSPMLHTKFRGNRPTGSGEEFFEGLFTIYERTGHLDHVTKISQKQI